MDFLSTPIPMGVAMVDPVISGPFVLDKGSVPNKSSDYQWTYKSKPRFQRTLPYRRETVLTTATNFWTFTGAGLILTDPRVLDAQKSAYARAYDKWYGFAGAKAQNMMNILEARSSLAMIANRAKQLGSFVNNLRKLRFGDAYKSLGIPQGERKTIQATTFSGAWLEYTFGWAPLIQDIGTSVEILQREFPAQRIRASGACLASVVGSDAGSSETALAKTKVRLTGGLKVTNSNLFLANQLGFVNPAAVLWDAVPFSFVVDWFLPVGKFLNSMSNDFGMEVDWPVVSRSIVASGELRHIDYGLDKPVYFTSSQIIRNLESFHRPDLLDRVHLPQMDNWLAATSVSLLMQQLAAAGRGR